MGEGQGANNAGGVVERVIIAEAATLLGVHPNTIRNRVKAGVYRAEKVVTERGPTWMIDRDSLTTNTPSSDSQQLVGRVPQEALTMLAREIVREAGLARDPEKEAAQARRKEIIESGREYLKAQVDFFKHMTTLSGGSIAVVIAVSATFLPEVDRRVPFYIWWFLAIGFLLLTSIVSVVSLLLASRRLAAFAWGDAWGDIPNADDADPLRKYRGDSFWWMRLATYFLFATGLGLFGLTFIFENLISP